MNNFDALIRALKYIEDNITEELNMTELANYSYISVSLLQKMFRYVFDYSVKEYITKRRLTIAAKELIETHDNVIDIALKYGYNSPETFTRAFKKLWKESPSDFRTKNNFMEIFPKINIEKQDQQYIFYKDSLGLYDYLSNNTVCLVICFDVVGLVDINRISRKIGDLVIVETVRRINAIREESMPLFRIGGDEFVLMVDGNDSEFCKKVETYISICNNIPIITEGKEIRVNIRTWTGKYIMTESTWVAAQDLIYKVKHAWE